MGYIYVHVAYKFNSKYMYGEINTMTNMSLCDNFVFPRLNLYDRSIKDSIFSGNFFLKNGLMYWIKTC